MSLGAEYVTGKVTGLEQHSLDDMITEVTGSSVLQNLNCAEVSHLDNEYCLDKQYKFLLNHNFFNNILKR